MSSDFYLKTQTLFKEFQNKELCYLNGEQKLNDTLMWKKDLNVPLQEYLQKIHQREKKNEETYHNIMKQMNELDQHTDLLFSKIDKLGIFRNIQAGYSLSDTNHSLTSRYISPSLNAFQEFNSEPTVSHFESSSLKSSMLKCASTQTESSVYCENCRYPIQISSHTSQLQNSSSSTIDILSVSKDEQQVIDSSRLQNDSFSFLSKNGNSQFNATSEKIELPQMYENEEHVEKNSKNALQVNDNGEAKSSTVNTVLEKKQFSLKSNESLIAENTPKHSASKQILIESQSKSNESEINIEVSKSDADSVNQEFDFLESDTAHLSSKVKTQISSKSNNQSGDINQAAGLDVKFNKSSVKLKNEKDTFQSNKEQELSDNRSEPSESISGTHSPVKSLSDSDSMNERGSFTASAAYQSLLGNTIIPSKVNKEVSESDSEDEVEQTLASTVKKSNLKAKSSSQQKKDKSASQPVDSKPAVNRPKPVSMNKPQSKLSKSTKKVLGIDTSSSSEVEAAVKPSENKKDEDSDEFDFYD